MSEEDPRDKPDAGQLLLAQIGLFNEAMVFYYRTIEPAFKRGLDSCLEAFVAEHGWLGRGEFAEAGSYWLMPRHWAFAEKPIDETIASDQDVWFEVHFVKSVDDCWLALFCDQGGEGGQAGFRFRLRPKGQFSGKTWDAYLRRLDSVQLSALSEQGFQNLGKEGFFLPVRLDPGQLAGSWKANGGVFAVEDAGFAPVRQAMETLLASLPLFDAILNGFMALQGGESPPEA